MKAGVARFLLATLLVGLASCRPTTGTQMVDESIVGGTPADRPALNAVGMLLYKSRGEWTRLCTAELIAPSVVLTAKHCAVTRVHANPARGILKDSDYRVLDQPGNEELSFAIGPDIQHLTRVVRVDAVDWCQMDQGGIMNLGCDMAVYYLAHAIDDVPPLAVRTSELGDDLVGTRMIVVGYGDEMVDGKTSSERRQGTMTLRGLHGAPLKMLFPTIDGFLDAVRADEGESYVQENDAELRSDYERTLMDGYDAFLVRAEGDAVTAPGDSGGPLLREVEGELTIHGVCSGGWGTPHSPTMAAYHATFGPKAQELVQRALRDPCEGIPAEGRCEGLFAARCSASNDGPRRPLRKDCGGGECRVPSPGASPDCVY